jgi:hypothetical protein
MKVFSSLINEARKRHIFLLLTPSPHLSISASLSEKGAMKLIHFHCCCLVAAKERKEKAAEKKKKKERKRKSIWKNSDNE